MGDQGHIELAFLQPVNQPSGQALAQAQAQFRVALTDARDKSG